MGDVRILKRAVSIKFLPLRVQGNPVERSVEGIKDTKETRILNTAGPIQYKLTDMEAVCTGPACMGLHQIIVVY